MKRKTIIPDSKILISDHYSNPIEMPQIQSLQKGTQKHLQGEELNGNIMYLRDVFDSGKYRHNYQFNQFGYLLKLSIFENDFKNGIDVYKYDQNENLIEISVNCFDPLNIINNQTKYRYNPNNELIEILELENGNQIYNTFIHYHNNLVSESITLNQDLDRIHIINEYDNDQRLIKKKIFTNSIITRHLGFTYDANSNIVEIREYRGNDSIIEIIYCEYEKYKLKCKRFVKCEENYIEYFVSNFIYDSNGYSVNVKYNNGEYSSYRFNNSNQELRFSNFDKNDRIISMRELIINSQGIIERKINNNYTGNRFCSDEHYSQFDNYGNWGHKTAERSSYGVTTQHVCERQIIYYI